MHIMNYNILHIYNPIYPLLYDYSILRSLKKHVQDIGFEIEEIGKYGIAPAKKEVYSLRTVPQKNLQAIQC